MPEDREQPTNPAPVFNPVLPPQPTAPQPSLDAPVPPVVQSTDTLISDSEQPVATAQPAPDIASNSLSAAPAVPDQAPTIKKRQLLPKKPLMVGGIALAVALLLGGGFVFGFYLPNTPDGIFQASLQNTAAAADRLIDYGKSQDAAHYKGAAYDGTVSIKSPSGSMDATLSGSSDSDANASLTVNADVLGQKGTLNIRSVHASGNESPDLYLQVTGVKPLLAQAGLDDLSNLDGQWISIDHTLIDTYAARLKATSSSNKADNATSIPTYAQIDDAARRLQTVNKQYLFTTDIGKAVLKEQKFIGQETVGGHAQNHYTVGYSKAHLKAYVDAMKRALDASKLNDWALKTSNKSLSSMLDFDGTKKDIDNAMTDYVFDLWADLDTKLVSKVTFKDPSDSSSTFSLLQDFHGTTSYPFSMEFSGKDDSGQPQQGALGLVADAASHKLTFTFKMTSDAAEGQTKLDATVHIIPSNSAVQVTAPAGAKSINEVLQALGFSDPTALLPSNSSDNSSAELPLIFQQ